MTAPGKAPSEGAIARATADLPLPDNPPTAIRRGADRRKELLREREIGARFVTRRLGLDARRHARAQHLDLRPDRRPHREEERERGKPDEIARAALRIEIGVEHGVGVRPQSALAEIHQEKGEIVEHIDRGEPIVELDRVEQDRRAVDLDDVAQMQIAVAVAHIASPGPRLEQGRERGEPVAACARKLNRRLRAAAHLHWRRIPPRCR